MDMVCFFQVGTFYEVYEDDASIVEQAFGIRITYTGVGKCRQVGVPTQRLESFCTRLVALGHRVGVIEEVKNESSTKLKKGRILREVLTPGNHVPSGSTGARCVLAVTEQDGRIGACAVDATSAEFTFSEFQDDATASQLCTLLAKLAPVEVLTMSSELSSAARSAVKVAMADDAVHQLPSVPSPDAAKQMLPQHLDQDASDAVEAIGGMPVALSCFGACVEHLERLLIADEVCSTAFFFNPHRHMLDAGAASVQDLFVRHGPPAGLRAEGAHCS